MFIVLEIDNIFEWLAQDYLHLHYFLWENSFYNVSLRLQNKLNSYAEVPLYVGQGSE